MLVSSVSRTCVSTRLASRMTKVSASRLTTTPRNLTFDPTGTGRVLSGRFVGACAPDCPKAAGANDSASARPKAAAHKRNARVSVKLIVKLHLVVWIDSDGRRAGAAAAWREKRR